MKAAEKSKDKLFPTSGITTKLYHSCKSRDSDTGHNLRRQEAINCKPPQDPHGA